MQQIFGKQDKLLKETCVLKGSNYRTELETKRTILWDNLILVCIGIGPNRYIQNVVTSANRKNAWEIPIHYKRCITTTVIPMKSINTPKTSFAFCIRILFRTVSPIRSI